MHTSDRASAPPPYRHRRALTRLLSRHRIGLSALCAALTLVSAVLLIRPPPAPTAQVLVADRDLDALEPLSAGDVSARKLPAAFLPDGALAPETDPVGRLLTGPVRRGEVLTDARLADPPAQGYGPDMVAAPVRVADPGAVALLRPGNRVDVLAAADDPWDAPGVPRPAVEVVTDRPVLAIPGEGPEADTLLLIAATPQEARELAGHAVRARLSVTLRG